MTSSFAGVSHECRDSYLRLGGIHRDWNGHSQRLGGVF